MNHKILFIDETGKHSYNHVSKYFILSACAITTDHLAEIRNKANNIIFKYWGSNRSFKRKFKRHNITFRAKEIFDCKGPFQILKDVKVKRTFWKDVYGELLSRMDITYFMTLVDKLEFKKNYPKLSDAEILSKSYEELLKSFLNFLIKSKIQGEIVAESSADQDQALVRSLSFFQRNSFTLYKNKTLVNEKVTSLSLINKNDNEIGSQIADLMAWTGSNKYMIDNKIKSVSLLRIEEKKLLKMFNKRLKSKSPNSRFNSYVVIK